MATWNYLRTAAAWAMLALSAALGLLGVGAMTPDLDGPLVLSEFLVGAAMAIVAIGLGMLGYWLLAARRS